MFDDNTQGEDPSFSLPDAPDTVLSPGRTTVRTRLHRRPTVAAVRQQHTAPGASAISAPTTQQRLSWSDLGIAALVLALLACFVTVHSHLSDATALRAAAEARHTTSAPPPTPPVTVPQPPPPAPPAQMPQQSSAPARPCISWEQVWALVAETSILVAAISVAIPTADLALSVALTSVADAARVPLAFVFVVCFKVTVALAKVAAVWIHFRATRGSRPAAPVAPPPAVPRPEPARLPRADDDPTSLQPRVVFPVFAATAAVARLRAPAAACRTSTALDTRTIPSAAQPRPAPLRDAHTAPTLPDAQSWPSRPPARDSTTLLADAAQSELATRPKGASPSPQGPASLPQRSIAQATPAPRLAPPAHITLASGHATHRPHTVAAGGPPRKSLHADRPPNLERAFVSSVTVTTLDLPLNLAPRIADARPSEPTSNRKGPPPTLSGPARLPARAESQHVTPTQQMQRPVSTPTPQPAAALNHARQVVAECPPRKSLHSERPPTTVLASPQQTPEIIHAAQTTPANTDSPAADTPAIAPPSSAPDAPPPLVAGAPPPGAPDLAAQRPRKRAHWNLGLLNISSQSCSMAISLMMANHNLDIAVLTEVMLRKPSDWVENGYKIVWEKPNNPDNAPKHAWLGVGFAIRVGDKGNPGPVFDSIRYDGPRVATLSTVWRRRKVSIIAAYAPPSTALYGDKSAFYEHLSDAIERAKGTFIIAGDFNANADPHRKTYYTDNCKRFDAFIDQHDLIISNFEGPLLSRRKRYTWWNRAMRPSHTANAPAPADPDSHNDDDDEPEADAPEAKKKRYPSMRRQGRTIDLILTPRNHRQSVKAVRPTVPFLAHADHKLVRARFAPTWKMNAQQPAPVPAPPLAAYCSDALADQWEALVSAYEKVDVPPKRLPERQAFATPEVLELIKARAEAYQIFKGTPPGPAQDAARRHFKAKANEVRRELRRTTKEYWHRYADTVDEAINAGRSAEAFFHLRPRYKSRPAAPQRDDDALEGCRKHFQSLLAPDTPPGGAPNADELLACAARAEINDEPPSDDEVIKALSQLKDTSPGADKLRAVGLRRTPHEVAILVREIWRTGIVPPAFKTAVLVALPKKAGATDWTDHRGITLLCVPSKVLTRIMLTRLDPVEILPEQNGFRRGSSTADAVMALKLIMDEGRRCGVGIVMIFVDLTKAYDTIPRGLLWQTLKRVGVGDRLIAVLQALYDDQMLVRLGRKITTQPFTSTLGVKQGCLLSPFLFNLIFDRVLRTCRFSGVPMGDGRVACRAYADDLVTISANMRAAQADADEFQRVCDIAGLTISTKKTEVMQMPSFRIEENANVEEAPEELPAGYHRTEAGHLYVLLPPKDQMVGGKYKCPMPGCTTNNKLYTRDNLSGHVNLAHSLGGSRPSLLLDHPHLAPLADISEVAGGDWKCNQCDRKYRGPKAKCSAQDHCHKQKHYKAEQVWVDCKGRPLEGGVSQMVAARRKILRTREEAGFDVVDDLKAITLRDATGARVPLNNVSQFKYLGRMVSRDGTDGDGVSKRIGLAMATARSIFFRLKGASRRTKLRIYKAIVRARLVYAAETWAMTPTMARKVDTFHMRWMRTLTGVQPKEVDGILRFPRNADVLAAADSLRMSDEIDVQRLRFWGHTLRRPHAVTTERFPIAKARAHFVVGNTLRGQLEALMEEAALTMEDAQNRTLWRAGVERLKTLRTQRIHQEQPEPAEW